MSHKHHPEGQAIFGEFERLEKGVQHLNILITIVSFALVALVAWLLVYQPRAEDGKCPELAGVRHW